jgi:imidazole glycerol-phosphate synthase subunit HisH
MLAIVDYDAGNLASVKRALDHLGIAAWFTADPRQLCAAERIVFPGVGHARSAMDTLHQRELDQGLREAFAAGTPILGICLGAQIVLSHSEEGDTECLGLIAGTCRRFELRDPALKIPHMGWDSIAVSRPHPVLNGIRPEDEFYFVHSYYPQTADSADTLATCEYETTFAAAIGRRNLVATQFHPEKSGEAGLAILRHFSRWDGAVC